MNPKALPRLVFALMIVVVLAGGLLMATAWPPRTRLVPLSIGSATLVLALAQLIRECAFFVRGGEAATTFAEALDIPTARGVPSDVVLRRALEAYAWIFGFFVAILMVGFLIAVPGFTLAYLAIKAKASSVVLFIGLVFTLSVVVGVFHFIMHVPWPQPWITLPQEMLIKFIGR